MCTCIKHERVKKGVHGLTDDLVNRYTLLYLFLNHIIWQCCIVEFWYTNSWKYFYKVTSRQLYTFLPWN
jgi:hypothetical protein